MLNVTYGESFGPWFDGNYLQLKQNYLLSDFHCTNEIAYAGWQAALASQRFSAHHKLLDHGYLRYVEHWGKGDANVDEAGIVEAARQSTQGSFRGWDKDQRLLEHLFTAKPQHSTPFEFAGLIVEVQIPIWPIREWHRHRTQSYNEMSARYEPLPNLNYVPTYDRCKAISSSNKQAGVVNGAEELTPAAYDAYVKRLVENYETDELNYQLALRAGVPKELARNELPLGRYTRMRAQANLRNWLAFITLRSDEKAAWEIQEYSRAVESIISQLFPRTYALFTSLRAG